MKLRSMFMALIAIFMMVGVAAAQDMPFDPCFGLGADDCAYINAANANGVGDATSFSIAWTLEVSGAGIPDPTMSEFSFSSNGSIDLVESTNPVLPINAGSVQEVAFSGMGDEGAVTVEFRLVDGLLYLQNPEDGTWISIDLVAVMSDPAFMEDALGQAGLPFNPMTGEGMENMPSMETLLPLFEILNMEGFITYVRDGETFTWTVDLTALNALFAAENQATLDSIVALATEIDPENGPAIGFMLPSIVALVQEGTITVTQVVNPELNIVERIGFTTDLSMDLATMMTGEAGEPTLVNIAFWADLTNLNSAAAPVAPEGATPVDLSEMGLGQ